MADSSLSWDNITADDRYQKSDHEGRKAIRGAYYDHVAGDTSDEKERETWVSQEPKHLESELKDRSAPGEVLAGFKSGVMGRVPDMVGKTIQWGSKEGSAINDAGKGMSMMAEEQVLENPEYMLNPKKHGAVVNALAGGAEMIAPSIAAPLAIGAGLTALPEAAIGAGTALAISSVAGAIPAAMAQGQETYENVKKAGGTEDEAKVAGWKNLGVEWGGETIANALGLRFIGMGKKALGMGASKLIDGGISAATDKAVVKPFLKNLAGTAVGEVATEMGQGSSQAYVEREAGVNGADPWTAAKDSIGPTLGMTALLAPLGLRANYKQSKQAGEIDKALSDPASASPAGRMMVVDMLHQDALKNGILDADAWRAGAEQDVKNGLPVRRNSDQAEQELTTQPYESFDSFMGSRQSSQQAAPTGPIGKAVAEGGIQATVQPDQAGPTDSGIGADPWKIYDEDQGQTVEDMAFAAGRGNAYRELQNADTLQRNATGRPSTAEEAARAAYEGYNPEAPLSITTLKSGMVRVAGDKEATKAQAQDAGLKPVLFSKDGWVFKEKDAEAVQAAFGEAGRQAQGQLAENEHSVKGNAAANVAESIKEDRPSVGTVTPTTFTDVEHLGKEYPAPGIEGHVVIMQQDKQGRAIATIKREGATGATPIYRGRGRTQAEAYAQAKMKAGDAGNAAPTSPVTNKPTEAQQPPDVAGDKAAAMPKEIWQMTRDEYIAHSISNPESAKVRGYDYNKLVIDAGAQHIESVKKAQAEGKQVPVEVLAEHGLAPTVSKTETVGGKKKHTATVVPYQDGYAIRLGEGYVSGGGGPWGGGTIGKWPSISEAIEKGTGHLKKTMWTVEVSATANTDQANTENESAQLGGEDVAKGSQEQASEIPPTPIASKKDEARPGQPTGADLSDGAATQDPALTHLHKTITKTYQAQADRLKAAGRPVPAMDELRAYADKEYAPGGQRGTVMDLMNSLSDGMAKKAEKQGESTNTETPPSRGEEQAGQGEASTGIDFSGNKLFKASAVEAAMKRLKEKRATLRSGFDPEMLQDVFIVGGAYFEHGARNFSTWATSVIDGIGKEFARYLPGVYENLRLYPGLDTKGMTPSSEVAAELNAILINEMDGVKNINATLDSTQETTDNRIEGQPTTEDKNELLSDNDPKEIQGRLHEASGGMATDTVQEPVTGHAEGKSNEGGDKGRSGDEGHDKQRNSPTRSRGRGAKKVHLSEAGESSGRSDGAGRGLAETPARIPATNFAITDDLELGKGSEGVKFKDNIAAIKALKQIEADGRRATPEEQRVLARYVGWGGLANAFRNRLTKGVADGWQARVDEVEALLTADELKVARNSTKAAHYTSQAVVRGIWEGVKRLGFTGGTVLEPSMGTGNFLGLAPQDTALNFMGVEYDPITARIATLLYPQASVLHSGFEKVPLPGNSFDLVIGNPPFGQDSLSFPYSPQFNRFSVHNQFMLAGIDALKPGGIQAFVVSRYFLDAKDDTARKAIAEKADLIGAIRLPDTVFKENARTDVVTDIVFFQKKQPAEKSETAGVGSQPDGMRGDASWTGTQSIPDPEGGEPMNISRYFADNPNNIIGTIDRTGSMRFGKDITVHVEKGADIQGLLSDKIKEVLPENIVPAKPAAPQEAKKHYDNMVSAVKVAMAGSEDGIISLSSDGRLTEVYDKELEGGSHGLGIREIKPGVAWSESLSQDKNGKWFREVDLVDEAGNKIKNGRENAKTKEVFQSENDIPASMRLSEDKFVRLKDAVAVLDALKKQIAMEMDGQSSAKEIEANRKHLKSLYDGFRRAHGFMNDSATVTVIDGMPDAPLLYALENKYKKSVSKLVASKTGAEPRAATAQLSTILEKRVIYPYTPQDKADNPHDALAITLSESGVVEMGRIAELLETDEQGVIDKLHTSMDKPLIYHDVETGAWVTADEYLSGNVGRKLEAAKEAGVKKNISALESVQPEPWGPENVTATLGANWISEKVYSDFAQHIGVDKATVQYSKGPNAYAVYGDSQIGGKWGTEKKTPLELLTAILNKNTIKIGWKDKDGTYHVDQAATELANAKAEEIKEEFADWVFKDGDRREALTDLFNKKYNNVVLRQRDGSHLTLPGKVPDEVIELRRHQKNGVWRGITDRFVLYDHAVGAGKTIVGIARAMERRRMGLSRKPMIVVPNHLVEQWAADVYRLYPGAKVLAATKKDLQKSKRRRLFAKIATGDWDIVIVPESSFGFIGISPETETRYLVEEIAQAEEALKEAQEQQDAENPGSRFKSPTVKAAESMLDKLTVRLGRLREAGGKKDRLLTFEQMGIDDLTIDEAHSFKNLFYHSNQNVRGMNPKEGSGKAYDLWNKIRTLRESARGSIAFLTGTPISNSAVEMYILQRYLGLDNLRDLGLEHFDAWQNQYASVATAYEPTESGRGLKEVTRLGRDWVNMRSLIDAYHQFADSVTNEDIKEWFEQDNPGQKFPLPELEGGTRTVISVKPTPAQEALIGEIVDGFNELNNIENPIERAAERLRLMNRAREVSLDAREVNSQTDSTEEGGKLQRVAEEATRIYKKWDKDKGTQLVFLDRSTPKASKRDADELRRYDDLLAQSNTAYNAGDSDKLRTVQDRLDKYNSQEMEAVRRSITANWNAYQQIKDNLIASGIPADEIRFIHEANTDLQKAQLFEQVNSGQVRVLIGSTPRMGAGTNVQERLVALHHVDVTWKPSDIEQREGRIIRQGNELYKKYGHDKFKVEIIAYVTETTVDQKLWALNATKLKMINGIRKYNGEFSMEFDDADMLGLAEIAAIASGEPLRLELVELSSRIDKLNRLKRAHRNQGYANGRSLSNAEKAIGDNPKKIAELEATIGTIEDGEAASNDAVNARIVEIDGEKFVFSDRYRALTKLEALRPEKDEDGKSLGKFRATIDGKEFTNYDKAEEYVDAALGDFPAVFSARMGGKEYTRRIDVNRDIAAKLTSDRRVDVEIKLGVLERNGIETEITAERNDDGTIDLSGESYIKGKDGQKDEIGFFQHTLTAAKDGKVLGVNVSKLFSDIEKGTSTTRFNAKKSMLEVDLARANKNIDSLRESANAPFPKEAELQEKIARMTEVEETLAKRAEDEAKLSVRGENADFTPADIKAELNEIAPGLLESGAVEIVSREQAAGMGLKKSVDIDKVQGFTDEDGHVYLVEGNIQDGNVWSVLKHEVGVHARKLLIGDKAFQRILNSLQERAKGTSATAKAIKSAMARIPQNTNQQYYNEEILAYLVEKGDNTLGVIRLAIARVKAALVKMGVSPKIFNVADFNALAVQAIRGGRNENDGRALGGNDTTTQGNEYRTDKPGLRGVGREVSNDGSMGRLLVGNAKGRGQGDMREARGSGAEVRSKSSSLGGREAGRDTAQMGTRLSSRGLTGRDLDAAISAWGDSPILESRAQHMHDGTRKVFEVSGKSHIVLDEKGNRQVFYHGSTTLGTDPGTFHISFNKIVKGSGSYQAGLGFFMTPVEMNAVPYKRLVGKIEEFYVRVNKTLEVDTREQGTEFARARSEWTSKADARAWAEKMVLKGYDSIHYTDSGEFIIIADANQIKTTDNTTFGKTKDYRYSIASGHPASLESIQGEVKGFLDKYSVIYTDSDTIDTSVWSRVFQSPEYYFKKVAALGRMMKAALGRRDLRFNYERQILGEEFIKFSEGLKETDAESYTDANDYLVDTDQTGYAFRMKQVADSWQVYNPEKDVIGIFEEEMDAKNAMMQAEHDRLLKEGYSANAAKAVLLARQVLNAEFDMRAADMRRIQAEYKANGLPDPFIGDGAIDEAGRYGVYADGKKKPIALFATQKEADESLDRTAKMISYMAVSKSKKAQKGIGAIGDDVFREFTSEQKAKKWAAKHGGKVKGQKRFGTLTVKKRTDGEMRPLTLSQAIAQMGDLRGSYFPRIRNAGEYVLIAKKHGMNPRREHFDLPVAGAEWGSKGTAANWTMAWVGKVFPNAAKRIQELKAQGYTVEFKKDDSPVDDIFDASKLIASIDAIIADNLSKINKNDSDEVKAALHVDALLTMQIADIFKGRGALSSRMKRLAGDTVWEGYETDMLKAVVQSARDTAAGLAKRDTSKAMLNAFTGRDFSWQDYKAQKAEEGERPSFTEYMEIIDDRRVHSGKQKNAYRDGRAFMIDVLRNSEHVDRIMGTLQGLAVLKFLGFRVSSAAVNLSNMVTGVPGTISGLTGESITQAMGRITNAAVAYGKYRKETRDWMSGDTDLRAEDRKAFQYIVDSGWDEAQYNSEAASVLRSKGGEMWNKYIVEYGMFMFGAVEKVNRATTIFAAYKAIMAKNPGMSFETAMDKAHEVSDRAHGVYGKETLPAWARGRMNPLRLTYTFQKFTHNYMMNMVEIGWNDGDLKGSLKKGQMEAALYLLLSPAILGGAGASLAGPALFALAGVLGIGGDDPEEEFYKLAADTFGSDTVARHGLAGLAGVNLKGSLGGHMPMPTDIGKATLYDLAGPVGGAVKDVVKSFGHFGRGEVAKGAEALLPTAFGSGFKALREGSEGVSTGNYGQVFYGNEPLKADTLDSVLRFFSFNPSRLSGIREKQWNEKEVAAKYQERKNEIYSELKRLHMQGKPYLTPETLKKIKRYNDLVRGSGRADIKPVTPQRIRLMMRRNSRASKFEQRRAARMKEARGFVANE